MITSVHKALRGALAGSGAMLALALPGQARADDDAAGTTTSAAAATAVPAALSDGRNIYTPADFERFAPRNALDMLGQVPGFTIRGGSDDRGLGQASDNVLINGARFAGKSESVIDQLARITAARVVRIEIVDGASLDIPGLSGQVANVVTSKGGMSGRFEWRGVVRPHYARPSFWAGEVSLSGSTDKLDYTLALSNQNGRGAAGGPTRISDRAGNLIERREGVVRIENERPRLSGNVTWDAPGSATGNLNLSYRKAFFDFNIDEDRSRPGDVDLIRDYHARERSHDYEIGGDFEFALGPGRLKLIGLERFERSTYDERSLLDFADDRADLGNLYESDTDSGERIARAEYSWKMFGGDWQLASEAAFNRLDRSARLFERDPAGDYAEIPFPFGSGGVTEDRYETILTYGTALSDKLTLQLGAGGEYSQLVQTGPGGLSRSFRRPKGSLSLAWAAEPGLDLSFKLSRKVGQLSFGDFLARVFLDDGKANGSNAELVPSQSWESELEVKQDLAEWGSTTLRLYANWYEDYIDIIPLEGGGEARGNVDRARLYGLNWTSTFNLDPIGWIGAKLDATIEIENSRIDDPLTGLPRPLSWHRDRFVEFSLRHDIPGTDLAWGGGLNFNHVQPYVRLYEVGRDYEGPIYSWAFVEHKDVFGLTVNLNVFNLNNGRGLLHRVVYDGLRDRAPIAYREERNQLVGPIFRLTVKGTF